MLKCQNFTSLDHYVNVVRIYCMSGQTLDAKFRETLMVEKVGLLAFFGFKLCGAHLINSRAFNTTFYSFSFILVYFLAILMDLNKRRAYL